MKKHFSFFILLSFLFVSCNSSKKASTLPKETRGPGVYFEKSNTLSDVLDLAAVDNKVVFVDMYTTWCLPCKVMDENVFSDKGIAKYMNDNFINYKVDAEKGTGPNLRDVYQVLQYPTLLFLDSKGRVLVRQEGGIGQSELMNLGAQALSLNIAN